MSKIFLVKKLLSLIALTVLLLPIHAQTINPRILAAANKLEAQMIERRHDFHANPELGNQEVRTAAIVAAHLKKLGLEVQTGVAVTGVVGLLKGGKPGPVVALRADMDALPVEEKNNLPFASKVTVPYGGKQTGVMHACGHDAHTAILMTVAEILSSMKSELKGSVKFIFQPAEEGVGAGVVAGAQLMTKEGVLRNPAVDAIFGLHMNAKRESGVIEYRPGGFFAGATDFKITVNGKGSHGAQPWAGIDPVPVAAQIVSALQTIVSRNIDVTQNAAVLTIGSIHGGNRHNVISDKVEMEGDFRSFSEADKKLMMRRIREAVEKTAEAAGATASVEMPYSTDYPVTLNNEAPTAMMLPALQAAAGKDKVMMIPAITGAEDFSYFAREVPGLFFRLGGMPKGQDPSTAAPHHTSGFLLDDSSFKLGVVSLCNLVLEYLARSENALWRAAKNSR